MSRMHIDTFTRNALIIMFGIVAIMSLMAYLGFSSGAKMNGTDAIVEENAAKLGKKNPTNLVTLDETGEYIGFTLAGVFSGLIIGYYWTELFGKRRKK
ncbi:MAG TPA: hypothetical protein EYP22_05570 [Methanosarcinales archaeon]|nr:hypothetical protein [Methanosarcinales archaeon]